MQEPSFFFFYSRVAIETTETRPAARHVESATLPIPQTIPAGFDLIDFEWENLSGWLESSLTRQGLVPILAPSKGILTRPFIQGGSNPFVGNRNVNTQNECSE